MQGQIYSYFNRVA